MKLYKHLLLSLAVAGSAAAFCSCEEEATLDGANVVYVEITPSEFTLNLGDTIPFHATVTNESGKEIKTSVKWSLTSEGVAQIIGDTALVSIPFDNLNDLTKQTKLRAELSNGKYALAEVLVTRGTPKGVMPVDTAGVHMPSKTSYMIPHDTIVFRVEPREVLYDFMPEYVIEGEGLAPYHTEPMRVNREAGTVTIHYSAARKAGSGKITVKVGSGASQLAGSCEVVMLPPIEGATFYGPDFAGMPYIESRPPCHTLRMYYSNIYNKTLDINKEDTIRVAINIQTGAIEDIREAIGTYEWRNVSGSNILVTGMYEEIFEGHGFDAVLVVRSGIEEGECTFQCLTSTDTLNAVYTVYNYKERFPVYRVYTDSTEVKMVAGSRSIIATFTEPMSSYGYQKPVVTIADPEIASVGVYEGNQIPITALKAGDTEIVVTSYGLEHRVPLHVAEGVSSVSLATYSHETIFVGEKVVWGADVKTPNGTVNPYPVTWKATDPSIVDVGSDPDDNNKGILVGMNPGKSGIQAFVLDKRSDERFINVVPSFNDVTLTESMLDMEDAAILTSVDGEWTFIQIPGSGEDTSWPYSNASVTLPFNFITLDQVLGTHTISGGNGFGEFDSAVAPLTSGTITVEDAGDSMVVITMDLVFTVPGLGDIHLRANNLTINQWLD